MVVQLDTIRRPHVAPCERDAAAIRLKYTAYYIRKHIGSLHAGQRYGEGF